MSFQSLRHDKELVALRKALAEVVAEVAQLKRDITTLKTFTSKIPGSPYR